MLQRLIKPGCDVESPLSSRVDLNLVSEEQAAKKRAIFYASLAMMSLLALMIFFAVQTPSP